MIFFLLHNGSKKTADFIHKGATQSRGAQDMSTDTKGGFFLFFFLHFCVLWKFSFKINISQELEGGFINSFNLRKVITPNWAKTFPRTSFNAEVKHVKNMLSKVNSYVIMTLQSNRNHRWWFHHFTQTVYFLQPLCVWVLQRRWCDAGEQ